MKGSYRLDALKNAPCGYLVMDDSERILATNERLRDWLGLSASEIMALPATHVFSVASRIIFETTLMPILRLQRQVEGVSLDLRSKDGETIAVLLSAECQDDGSERLTRLVFLKASARRDFEHEIIKARAEAEANLARLHREGELREQFVAILGHDLRNPVAAVSSGIRILSREPLSENATMVTQLMLGSVQRMSRLIDNVLDFARSRLGDGIDPKFSNGKMLEEQLLQVLEELRSVSHDRKIQADISIRHDVQCDVWRIGQMLSNLLGNALTHGDPSHPVIVNARTFDGGGLELWVSNRGDPIPPSDIERLFDPFVRSTGPKEGKSLGLGLGLFISMEIAKTHGGGLEVISDENETRFTFRMAGMPRTADLECNPRDVR